jgi:hypothetical protein
MKMASDGSGRFVEQNYQGGQGTLGAVAPKKKKKKKKKAVPVLF